MVRRIRFEGGGHDGEEYDLPEDSPLRTLAKPEPGTPLDPTTLSGIVAPEGNYLFDRLEDDVAVYKEV